MNQNNISLDAFLKEYEDKGFERVSSNEHCLSLDDALKNKMLEQLRSGRPKGTTTYFSSIDPHWKWRAREFNIWTGYNNEGKTQLLNELCLIKAIKEGDKFAMFSPENMPEDDFYIDLAEVYVGKPADKDKKNCMSEREMRQAIDFLREHFFLVYPTKANFTMQNIEGAFEWLIGNKGVQHCVLDPYLKVRHSQRAGEGEHQYIARFMAERIDFCRTTDITYHLVAHQNTPRKNDQGNYPEPDLYNIKGGGSFADSTDNVLIVQRPLRGSDPTNTHVNFVSKKIKKQKLVGIPGTAQLDYDRYTMRYYEIPNQVRDEGLMNNPEFDWREVDMRSEAYSPLARAKGEVSDNITHQKSNFTPIRETRPFGYSMEDESPF